MSAYKELLQQREALEIQIKEARARELSDAIALVRKTVDEFGLTVSDVFRPSDRRSPSKGSKVEPKYRNPATGETWTGRGKPPVWIRNEDREQFRIKQ
jgi:DNA-binding protein H-NS